MPVYMNLQRHAVDVPGGAFVAPGGSCELEAEVAEPLVQAGVLTERLPVPEPKTTKKGASS